VSLGLTTRSAERQKQRELRKMKLVATSFLIGSAVTFIVARRIETHGGPTWIAYLRAAAEAGMVGGIADWFAVTALFRHPLGIPIPHTAIIPRRKDAIAEGLSEFVSDNFLSEIAVREKLSSARIAQRFGFWISDATNAQTVTNEMATGIAWMTDLGDDEQIAAVIELQFRRIANNFDAATPLAALVDRVIANEAYGPVVDLLVETLEHRLVSDPQRAQDWFDKQLPKWLPGFGKDRVGEWVYEHLIDWTQSVRSDLNHPIRKWVERGLVELADNLRNDTELGARVNEIKMQLVDRGEIRHTVSDLWVSAKNTLNDDAQNPESPLRVKATSLLVQFGEKLTADATLRHNIDSAIEDVAGHLVDNYRDEIAGIITDTIARWDANETSRKIELHVGRDLQFIRVNGTVVGALAGLVIYSVGQLVAS
jgi:uncharacterized membrane-anchored protein YjiN (DUF445 family)